MRNNDNTKAQDGNTIRKDSPQQDTKARQDAQKNPGNDARRQDASRQSDLGSDRQASKSPGRGNDDQRG